ncbi:MarR family transcriptional regulator [Streptomyces cocklensis]|uniref:DNA-binding transcriptional regulator, MarR family n=1 Tax=Actinacidiphila cocklensis TaxID=887465 RepID=A0A9W4GRW9_9ACTN|nr:MarR family transcriptional regulator [Actinacidiphila cocklensis]MDD1058019.1 MarR family transcriptional regulator [Actinacidiphila cocklensis]WSX79535.1 MarR family transcriptional regulator [Streptomyces sp. NBC_00899]CAG6393041.1 DNA-binding transcriptional regulator, MarR family [Actinacidiphila cocklensis]
MTTTAGQETAAPANGEQARGREAVEAPGESGDEVAEVAEEAAERVWRNLRSLVLERNERRKEVAEALGMSFFRAKALRRIAKRPSQMGELAAELASDRPYLTLVVDDLEKRGLVERRQHPTDRRCKIVSATEAGLAAAARANAILRNPPPALLALSAADLADLDRITSALAAHPQD